MDCPHCGTAFYDVWSQTTISGQNDARWAMAGQGGPHITWYARMTVCPSCNDATIDLRMLPKNFPEKGETLKGFRVYPQNTYRKPTPKEIPTDIKEDYEEACKVLPTSHKASAALSRRCLQAILQRQGYNQKDLAKQIEALLNEADPVKAIPTALRATVDAVRNFGNFSAHPITDQTTSQLIPVEENEAEWCLEILDEMFDHYYVKPKQAADRKAALDAKLTAAGKPRSK